MNRVSWILLGLLVASNAVWWWQRADDRPPAPSETAGSRSHDPAPLRARIADLEAQLAKAKERPALAVPSPEERAARAKQTQAEARAKQDAEAQARRERMAKANAAVDAIMADALQIEDEARRAGARDRLASVLQSDNVDEVLAALQGLIKLRDQKYDRERFRGLILPHLESGSAWVRRTAVYALYNNGVEDGDLEYALAIAKDPDPTARESASHLIKMYAKGKIHDEPAEAVMSLLQQKDRRHVKEAMRGIWGADCDERIHARLIQIAQDPKQRHDAIYFGLSTMNPKSKPVVDELLKAVLAKKGNEGRAEWGLGYGVPEALQPQVAETYAKRLTHLTSPYSQRKAVEMLGKYGTLEHRAQLEAIEQNELADKGVRRAARNAIRNIDRRRSK